MHVNNKEFLYHSGAFMHFFNTDCQSPEYLVAIKYYSKLVDTVEVVELSHYFVSHGIISTKYEEEIKNTTPPVRAAILLLSRVINPLKAGNDENFYNFLYIAEHYGNDAIRHLSTTIRKNVLEMKDGADVKGTKTTAFFYVHFHYNILS